MPASLTITPPRIARRLRLRGFVQGLGVRPAIHRLAGNLGLAGYVQNTPDGVEILVEGSVDSVAGFVARLPSALPPEARLEACAEQVAEATGRAQFEIIRRPAAGPLAVRVPQDLAVCENCRREVLDASDRRFRYPLISCTQCGPRYSIIRALPYERADTTMAEFAFCAPCEEEYTSPDSRRFHAQTNACKTCGPQIWAMDSDRRQRGAGEDALRFSLVLLRSGKILALKGIGGYQLLVDATNGEAVHRLRARKHRPAKPLAVMVRSLEAAHQLALIDQPEREALCGPSNPIVLLRARGGTPLCSGIRPQLDSVGLMLPTTPLHALLAADFGRPLVCTSGNDDGDPLMYREPDAETVLAGVCDGWLHHDRAIARPIDDSVVRVIAGRCVTIRLARGLAPLPLEAPADGSLVALGGHMKSAAAWSNGRQAVLGPHVGELETLSSRRRFIEQLDAWRKLYRFRPLRFVHDLHPDYFTTQLAQQQNERTLAVQHHHAHVVAGMLEEGWLDRTVLGVSWDGTGYGPDGTIWGGEFLVATVRGYQRLGRLRPFPLPGGEACIHHPWRTALSVIAAAVGNEQAEQMLGRSETRPNANVVLQMIRSKVNAPVTSSAGRLFDAAAQIILGVDRVDYEGQAAMALESVADPSVAGRYAFPLVQRENDKKSVAELDWRPLFAELLADRRRGASPGEMAMRFHRTLAAGIVRVCRRRPDLPVVLGGGVFQNRLLTELLVQMLYDHPQPLGLPGAIPPGDGGLAAGQLAVALAHGEKC